MATKNPAPAKVERDPSKGLRIVAKREGFRRAGFVFGTQAETIALTDLDEDQEAALRKEFMLVVVDIALPTPGAPEAPAEKAKA